MEAAVAVVVAAAAAVVGVVVVVVVVVVGVVGVVVVAAVVVVVVGVGRGNDTGSRRQSCRALYFTGIDRRFRCGWRHFDTFQPRASYSVFGRNQARRSRGNAASALPLASATALGARSLDSVRPKR